MKRHNTYLSRSSSSFTVPSRKERTKSFPTAFPVTMLNDFAIDSAYCYASHPDEKRNSGLGFLETFYRERKTGIRIFDDKSIVVSIEDIKNRIHAKMNLVLFPSSVEGSLSLNPISSAFYIPGESSSHEDILVLLFFLSIPHEGIIVRVQTKAIFIA